MAISSPGENGREIELPLTLKVAKQLRAGDEMELTGYVYSGRDQACARIFQMIQEGVKPPIDLAGELIYFVGPSPARPGQAVGSAGPTTSGRMNKFMPTLLEHGLRGFIGKGYLDQAVKEALTKHVGVYFGAIGGTGALLSLSIEEAKLIAFPELLSEAIHQMKLKNFPVVVLNDSRGGDLYAQASSGAS
jgi:fumarate hydratase subunit beta